MTNSIRVFGMETTDAINDYVQEKIMSLNKYYENIIHVECDLGLDTHHHNKGEIYKCTVSVQVPNHIFRVEKEEKDLYKAIDKVRDHLREEITAWKEKNREAHRNAPSEGLMR